MSKDTQTAKDVEKQHQHITDLLKQMGMKVEDIEQDFVHYLYNTLGRSVESEAYYQFKAMSYTVRDRVMNHWKKLGIPTTKTTPKKPITCRWSF